MSSTDDTADVLSCANCGKDETVTNKLKRCVACKMVKYCNRDCQVAHHPKHKKACKKRAAELFDEQLFRDHPERPECPICTLAMPFDEKQIVFNGCCGQRICYGCIYGQNKEGIDNGKELEDLGICPFCRAPQPISKADYVSRVEKCVEKNNAEAMNHLGDLYYKAGMGLPRDRNKAVELYRKAGELGCAKAYFMLANAYESGEEIRKDKKKARYYWGLAAIGGDIFARHKLGHCEIQADNSERAKKHFMIGAKAGDGFSLHGLRLGLKHGFVTKDEYREALRACKKQQDDIKSATRDHTIEAVKYWNERHDDDGNEIP